MRIQKEIENVERVKDKIATMPLTMEDAIEFHKQVVDRIEKERKEINKELGLDSDIEEKGFTGASKEPKKVSTPELKKMKLAESLFNSLNESLSIEWWNNPKNRKAAEKVVLKEYSSHMTREKANQISVIAKSDEIDVDIPTNILAGLSDWIDRKACEKLNNFFKKNNVNIKAKERSYIEYIWFELDFGEDEKEDESLNEGIKGINLKDYDDGYVEMRDGVPQFVYDRLRDARNGIMWSIRGDHEAGDRKDHRYEIKQWKNGELVDLDESLNESFIKNEKQLAKYIADNFEEITGLNVKDIYNTESDEEIFNQDYVDITYPKIKQFIYDFNEDNDTNFDEEDILYLLDDELSSYKYFNESLNECDKFKKGDCKNYALDEAKISRQNQRRKKDANLARQEAEARKRAEREKKLQSEEDWYKVARDIEDQEGDFGGYLDSKGYTSDEKEYITKYLDDIYNDKNEKAAHEREYQRNKKVAAEKQAEEERKKAEQEKEEKTKKNLERIGKLANAPKDIGNAFKKGLGIS